MILLTLRLEQLVDLGRRETSDELLGECVLHISTDLRGRLSDEQSRLRASLDRRPPKADRHATHALRLALLLHVVLVGLHRFEAGGTAEVSMAL